MSRRGWLPGLAWERLLDPSGCAAAAAADVAALPLLMTPLRQRSQGPVGADSLRAVQGFERRMELCSEVQGRMRAAQGLNDEHGAVNGSLPRVCQWRRRLAWRNEESWQGARATALVRRLRSAS
eukprot:1150373-Pelagomonas_calceolata.AAC.3